MFMSDISAIVRRMRAQADRSLEELGIGFPEQLVLMFLCANGPSNQESIAAKLNIDKGAVAKTIAKLEGKNLISRQVNPKNRREKIVELAPDADALIQRMSEGREAMEGLLFAGFSPEEIEHVCALLARIARNVSEDGKD